MNIPGLFRSSQSYLKSWFFYVNSATAFSLKFIVFFLRLKKDLPADGVYKHGEYKSSTAV